MIALVLPNQKCSNPLESYVVSVDHVEDQTGIDFFPALADDLENKLEAKSDASLWEFKTYKSSSTANKSTAVQCKGTAKSTGVRCKNRTTNQNGYCHYHQNQATGSKNQNKVIRTTSDGRCQAITQKGTRCKRKSEAGSRYCWQHKK
jgi:endonuclease G